MGVGGMGSERRFHGMEVFIEPLRES